MSRKQKVAAVETYLDCFAKKDLSQIPLAEDVTFEGPLVPKLTGPPNYQRIPSEYSSDDQRYPVEAAHCRGGLRCNCLRHGNSQRRQSRVLQDSHFRWRDQGNTHVLLSQAGRMTPCLFPHVLIEFFSIPSFRPHAKRMGSDIKRDTDACLFDSPDPEALFAEPKRPQSPPNCSELPHVTWRGEPRFEPI